MELFRVIFLIKTDIYKKFPSSIGGSSSHIERKTSSPSQFEEYTIPYPNLKKKIRIELSKRINRESFSSGSFP